MASAAGKMKSSSNQGGSSSKGNTSIIKKKIESTTSRQQQSVKSEEKGKTATPTKKREKKVFSLAGQKFDVPEEREPLRIFYESLSEQIPTSEMAEFWLMEHGMLSPDRSKKAFERKQRKTKMAKMGTPIKYPPTPSKPESSNRQRQQPLKNGDTKTKKRMNDSDDEVIRSPKMRRGY